MLFFRRQIIKASIMYSLFSRINFLILTIFSIVLLASCGPDSELNPNGDQNFPEGSITASVYGTVIDENNQPVVGATVKSGSNTTTTDRFGVFQFKNILLGKSNGYVRVEKAGYFNGNKSFYPTPGRTHNVKIKLIPKTVTVTLNANTGGTVNFTGGASLFLPTSAIADAAGNPFTGSVTVSMTWIDPTAPNLPDLVPGELRGWTTANEERGLETYGMIGVDLTGPGNTKLYMAPGRTAQLTFPVPASLAGSAPTIIDLWNFDEASGRWEQEGTATKTGSNYVGNVSHFSFWNVDAQFPVVNLCMGLQNQSNQPLNNVQVRIKRANGSYGYGRTDNFGKLCGKVPKNESLVLQVMDQCDNVIYSQNIGPFSTDVDLGTISVVLPTSNTLTITGTLVDCNNSNVTNGAVSIYVSGGNNYYVPVTNGTFSLTILKCNTNTNFAYYGSDFVNNQSGVTANGTGTTGTVNLGNVSACGNATNEYIDYLIGGNIYSFRTPGSFSQLDTALTNSNYFFRTLINALPVINSDNTKIIFDNNALPGDWPLWAVRVQISSIPVLATQFVNPNPVVHITRFGQPGQYIEGYFSEQMILAGFNGMTTIGNVTCNFRVRRN